MRDKHLSVIGGAALAATILSTTAHAAVYTVDSPPEDREAYTGAVPGTSNGVSNDLRAGVRTINDTVASAVFFFALPTIPTNEQIIGATFTVELNAAAGTSTPASDANVDLYGLGIDPAPPAVSASQAYTGANDTTAGVVKLQENFFVPADATATDPNNRKTSVDISGYIEGLILAGAQPGDFLVLRLSYDDTSLDLSTTNRYRFRSGDDAVPLADQPILTITTAIPEPAGLAVMGFGAGLLASRRRRR
jgi:hypothetical protein